MARTPRPGINRAPLASAALLILLGGLQALAFAPWPAWWLQLLTLSAALALVRKAGERGWRHTLLASFLFQLACMVAGLSWLHISMHRFGGMPWGLAALAVLLFGAYLALFGAAACALAARLAPGWRWSAGLAAAWTLGEILRAWLFTGFGWLSVGYAHVDSPLAGLAPWLGVHGISLAAVFIAAILTPLWMRPWFAAARHARLAAAAGLPLLLGSGLQTIAFTEKHGEPVSVRLVQGNVPQQMKFEPGAAIAAMQAYTEAIAQSQAALTVLPETAWVLPWHLTPPALLQSLHTALRGRADAAVLIGIPIVPAPGIPAAIRPLTQASDQAQAAETITNGALLLRADGERVAVAGRYDKHHLVPFGEFIPPGFAWFVQMMRIPLGSFGRGSLEQPAMLAGGQRFAVNICYEDLFGDEIAAVVRGPASPGVLVNLSNIAWFGASHALPQHLAIARMRSLETGRPMLRATNTGVTALIDHRGKVMARLADHQHAHLDVQVQATRGLTPYVRWGDTLLPWLCLALLAVILWARQLSKRSDNASIQ